MAPEEMIEKFSIKVARNDFGSVGTPPLRLGRSMLKADAAKLPCIAKNQCAPRLPENEVIVFFGDKIALLDPQFAAHPEVQAKPAPNTFAGLDYFGVIARKGEEHLFSPRFRAEQFLPDDPTFESRHIGPAEDPFLPVELHAGNDIAESGIPKFAVILDLGQFRHARKLDRPEAPCYPWRAWKKSSSSGAAAPA